MFTPAERSGVLDRLVIVGTAIREVLGMLLVGSGAEGFNDKFSDLDLVYVVEPQRYSGSFSALQSAVESEVRSIFRTTYHHRVDVTVMCCLLDHLLEVDVGVWSSEVLFASSSKWKLIWARDPAASALITDRMHNNQPSRRDSELSITGDHTLWQSIHGRFISGQRGNDAGVDRFQAAISRKLAKEGFELGALDEFLNLTYTTKQIALLNRLK
jgi:predicted nucleotidyltransferase